MQGSHPPERQPEVDGLISSRRNPLVQRLRELHSAKGRRSLNLLLLEGTHLAQESLRLGLAPVDLVATPRWLEHNVALRQGLLALIGPAGRVIPATEMVLAAMATTEHPDGVVMTLHPPRPKSPSELGFGLVLDGVQDPGNLGTLLRTALAAGIEQVWQCGGADPLQPKVLRASAGAALALPPLRQDPAELQGQLQLARSRGMQLVASVPPGAHQAGRAAAKPYWELDWCRPTLLLLGSEGAGLSPALLEHATDWVTVPHSPAVESLNVAVAAAPLLLERLRQQVRMPPSDATTAP